MLLFKNIKKELMSEHKGFAISFEVMMTLVMITVFASITFFCLLTMNAQRFMNTVLTSTAAEAARWGGFYSYPYSINVETNGKSILQNAQDSLNQVVPEFSPIIQGHINGVYNANQIQDEDDDITIIISYDLPLGLKALGDLKVQSSDGTKDINMWEDITNANNNNGQGRLQMEISVKSLMSPGKLMGG